MSDAQPGKEPRAPVPSIDRVLAWPGALFIMISVSVVVDLAADVERGMSTLHLGTEAFALLLALGGIVATACQLRRAYLANCHLLHDLEGTRADLTRWRMDAEDLLRGLGAAIDRHFAEWGLSSAEREVALLILKGLSYKDVASARNTSERTVRHQAVAIYRKAGVAGRAEMAAFFLEDLLLPPQVGAGHVASATRDGSHAPVISLAPRKERVPLASSGVTAEAES
jgi:DNA-binding CsgD family transcriptional regulator